MKHTYKITGMTCVGCETSVESALGNLKEITKVETNLKKEEVVLEMTSHVSLEKITGNNDESRVALYNLYAWS